MQENKLLESNVELLKFFLAKGFLLDNNLINFFSQLQDKQLAEISLQRIATISKTKIINKSLFLANFIHLKPLFANSSKRDLFEKFFSVSVDSLDVIKETNFNKVKLNKEDYSFKILSSNIIPDRKIEVKDFVRHFKNRYNFIRDILKNRKELDNLVSIDKISRNSSFSIIGLVANKRITKNNNFIIEVEDLTGRATILINQNREELFKKAKEIVLDDIIGIKCRGGSDIFYAEDFFFAESSLVEKKKIEEDIYAVFTSDIHMGSSNFLEDNFSKFIDWLNGVGLKEEEKIKIQKIRYLFIVGDNVDGVGIYPAQEPLLKINDMRGQYKKLAFYLDKIPKHITILMCPGQHDSVRVPEPQPPIDEDFAEPLMKISNLYLVSNPALIEIGIRNNHSGIKVLMYHGASIHGWIDDIEELRLANAHHSPAKVIKHILKHRHLSPTHSGTTYVPDEKEDFLVIKEIPDIITTGEVHRTDIDYSNNILIICNSCWQSITPYEEKVGNQPDPCKVPMLNLKTREIKILDFS